MQQESEHLLGACLFDLFVDLTYLSIQLVYLVVLLAEDDLQFGDGLSHVLFEFGSGDLCFGFYLFGMVIGASNGHWIGSKRVAGGCCILLGCALLSLGSCSLLRSPLADQEGGLAWLKPAVSHGCWFLGPLRSLFVLYVSLGSPGWDLSHVIVSLV